MASIIQSEIQQHTKFEITEATRKSVLRWMEEPLMIGSEHLWLGHFHERLHISTRQYSRLVREWVTFIGLDPTSYGTHSMRRIGHWRGGRLAAQDTGAALRWTGWVMVAAAVFTAGATLVLRVVAEPVLVSITNPLAVITAFATLTFFLPSLFAGVPAPVLAIVAMRREVQSERALGAMFAAGAAGAIVGTLLTGLFVSWLGSVGTLSVIAVSYALAASICAGRRCGHDHSARKEPVREAGRSHSRSHRAAQSDGHAP